MNEIVLNRDRVECLVRELDGLLSDEKLFQFKIQFDEEKIIIVPFVRTVEIVIGE